MNVTCSNLSIFGESWYKGSAAWEDPFSFRLKSKGSGDDGSVRLAKLNQ